MSTLFTNRGHFYCPHVMPVVIDCNFVVDSSNANGLGISSLKGQGVKNVFMHTSQTPGRGNGNFLNPNPGTGVIEVQLSDNYMRFYDMFSSFRSPNSGTSLVATTANVLYTITNAGASPGYVFTVTSANATEGAVYTNNSQSFTVLKTISSGTTLVMSGTGDPAASGTLTKSSGTGDSTITFSAFTGGAATTAAQWLAAGVHPGVTPAIGVSFVAIASASIGGSAQVQVPSSAHSAIDHIEVLGNPNVSLNPIPVGGSPNVGGYIYLLCLLDATATAPTDGSVLNLAFYLSQSSVVVSGE